MLDELPNKVKEYTRQKKIEEGHLHEIMALLVNEYLADWLSTEEVRMAINS